ncbi:MAG: YicC/YloC family endoribonuclease [Burkholderiaceae bacterium]
MNDRSSAKRPVQSMTGFASAGRDEPLPIHIELRGVNGRFLDLVLRMPDELRGLERELRERIRTAVVRGKVECRVSLNRDTPLLRDTPDPEQLARVVRHLEALRAAMPELTAPSASTLLGLPGLFSHRLDPERLRTPLLGALDEALGQFHDSRIAEGARLAEFINARLDAIDATVEALAAEAPALLERFQSKLIERLEQALGKTEGAEQIGHEEIMARVRQEVAAYGLRIDTAEELDRLRSHVREFRTRLSGQGPVGKRLDFLTQELNREANTLASKAAALDISHAAVELKVLIEQIREQIQNLE